MVTADNTILGYVDYAGGLFEARDAELHLVGISLSRRDAVELIADLSVPAGIISQRAGKWMVGLSTLVVLVGGMCLVLTGR